MKIFKNSKINKEGISKILINLGYCNIKVQTEFKYIDEIQVHYVLFSFFFVFRERGGEKKKLVF